MRNFERQADLFCFQVGIDPAHMISSFMKLGVAHHDDGKRTNWHHFTIPQRIDFLRRCEEKPEMVNQHKKKLNRSLVIFILVMISLILLTYSFRLNSGAVEVDLNLFVNNIHQKIQKDPENPGLYKLLGLVYYEMKKWRQSKRAYEISLKLNYNQPEILNNLAWLLLKSGDKDFYDPKRALRLVRDAVELKETHYNLDTLAEAYHANGMYKEAFLASKRALEALKTEANVTGTDRVYLKKQLERMKKAYLNKSSIKI